ncbi:cystathionine beta-lyase [Microvirga rosea]|uniref:cystathionine beta-lyase n=1 Tax=Microvirga rosea TaxID=2715425 RepID=UPI001D0BBF6F|nr:cystathionine beta-lyase [Microvirga rosea]MCB8819070.1 cystathionine beta-lyase [Microvirga rosea]
MTSWRTTLIHPGVAAPEGFHSLVSPTYRGSTTLFRSAADVQDTWRQEELAYSYGLYGTPTTLELAARIGELERARHTLLTPGGQAAIALIYLAFARSGDHVLVPDSIYGPNRALADGLLASLGIDVTYYDPLIGQDVEALLRPNTRLIWCESPGSVTMEVQDVPAIAAVARRHGIVVALDNTYAAGILFDAFAHGVDVSMQALTKYVGGHSDLLLGSVSVREESHYTALGKIHQLLGMAVSPDDGSLALRGLQTLGVRLDQLERGTLAVARWLGEQRHIQTVLHPALPSCPGHENWARDFTGSASVFSVVFASHLSKDSLIGLIDRLRLFKIGYSWGGVTSLAVPYFDAVRQVRSYGGRLVRFNIGLEDPSDLIADLEQAFAALGGEMLRK